MESPTTMMVSTMAFDIYGLGGSQTHEMCLRFNIWKWNDIRLLLNEFNLFLILDESLFMANDGYEITGEKYYPLIKTVRDIYDIEYTFKASGKSWITSKLESLSEVRKYSKSPSYGSEGQLSLLDINLLYILLGCHDGIRIS